MDFDLSEDHQMLSDTLRRYLSDNYTIEARNRDATAAPCHSPEIWAGLAEPGTIGAFVTEAQGGFGGSAEDVSVIFEELGRSLCAERCWGRSWGCVCWRDWIMTNVPRRWARCPA